MAFSMDETEEKDKGESQEGDEHTGGKPWIVISLALVVALLGLMFYGSLREFTINSVPNGPQSGQE